MRVRMKHQHQHLPPIPHRPLTEEVSNIVRDCQRLSKIVKDCQEVSKNVKDCQKKCQSEVSKIELSHTRRCTAVLLLTQQMPGRYQTYAQSKLANVLFAQEAAKRAQGTGVLVNSANPGICHTNIASGVPERTAHGLRGYVGEANVPLVRSLLESVRSLVFSVAWNSEGGALTQVRARERVRVFACVY